MPDGFRDGDAPKTTFGPAAEAGPVGRSYRIGPAASKPRSFHGPDETNSRLAPALTLPGWRVGGFGIESRSQTRLHHPIIDCDVTTPEGYDAIIADIDRQLAAGRPVYIHCWGGMGRTGTVVGWWHVTRGATAEEAFARAA